MKLVTSTVTSQDAAKRAVDRAEAAKRAPKVMTQNVISSSMKRDAIDSAKASQASLKPVRSVNVDL